MKVNVLRRKKVPFFQINCGSCFQHDDDYYMKCSYQSKEHFYGVNLQTGHLFTFDNNDFVYPVTLEACIPDLLNK